MTIAPVPHARSVLKLLRRTPRFVSFGFSGDIGCGPNLGPPGARRGSMAAYSSADSVMWTCHTFPAVYAVAATGVSAANPSWAEQNIADKASNVRKHRPAALRSKLDFMHCSE